MKDLPVYALMAMYAIPALSLFFIDALDGFSRIKYQPGGAMIIFGICAFVQLWGALIMYLDKKEKQQ